MTDGPRCTQSPQISGVEQLVRVSVFSPAGWVKSRGVKQAPGETLANPAPVSSPIPSRAFLLFLLFSWRRQQIHDQAGRVGQAAAAVGPGRAAVGCRSSAAGPRRLRTAVAGQSGGCARRRPGHDSYARRLPGRAAAGQGSGERLGRGAGCGGGRAERQPGRAAVAPHRLQPPHWLPVQKKSSSSLPVLKPDAKLRGLPPAHRPTPARGPPLRLLSFKH